MADARPDSSIARWLDGSIANRSCLGCYGQALTELAIFGGLLLIVLAVLVRFGLILDYQQNLEQDAFRKALRTAVSADGDVSYTIIKDRPVVDASDPFALSPRSRVGGFGRALWSDALFDVEGEAVSPILVELNNETLDFTGSTNVEAGDELRKVRTVKADRDLRETPEELKTTRDIKETEQITSTIGGRTITQNLSRSRRVTWTTPFEQ